MITLQNPNRRKEPLTEQEEKAAIGSIESIIANATYYGGYSGSKARKDFSNIQALLDQYCEMKEKLNKSRTKKLVI